MAPPPCYFATNDIKISRIVRERNGFSRYSKEINLYTIIEINRFIKDSIRGVNIIMNGILAYDISYNKNKASLQINLPY